MMRRAMYLPSTTRLGPLPVARALVAILLTWCDLRRLHAALAGLDVRLLADIGVSRAEALVESRKVF